MNSDFALLLDASQRKMQNAIALVEASLSDLPEYKKEFIYSPKEREPFDALCDRFVRAVEISIKYFKTLEYYLSGEKSDNLRDSLNQMEKLGLISGVDLWMDMRAIRNRIVHDYLPDDLLRIYQELRTLLGPELSKMKNKEWKK